jgi:hypothetical protein
VDSRSRAFIYIRTDDQHAVLSHLERYLRGWDFRSWERLPDGYVGRSGTELRELYVRGAQPDSPWVVLAVEDLQNVLQVAYALSSGLGTTPVLASRRFTYGDWHLKAYLGRDCILKVGDDPDHELAWVGPPLSEDKIGELTDTLGGDAAFTGFLKDVLQNRHNPLDLIKGLRLPRLNYGFIEIRAGESAEWSYRLWIHERSPLNSVS